VKAETKTNKTQLNDSFSNFSKRYKTHKEIMTNNEEFERRKHIKIREKKKVFRIDFTRVESMREGQRTDALEEGMRKLHLQVQVQKLP